MARLLGTNSTDTPQTGVSDVKLTIPALNYSADFRVMVDRPEEAVITNITSPLDEPERFRFAHQSVADVYKGSGVDPTLYYATRKGTQILCQLTEVLPVTDSENPLYRAVLPLSCHLVIKVPNNDLMSAEVVTSYIERMLAGLYEVQAGSQTSRLRSLLRGALLPTVL